MLQECPNAKCSVKFAFDFERCPACGTLAENIPAEEESARPKQAKSWPISTILAVPLGFAYLIVSQNKQFQDAVGPTIAILFSTACLFFLAWAAFRLALGKPVPQLLLILMLFGGPLILLLAMAVLSAS